jgi:hypothetical protein
MKHTMRSFLVVGTFLAAFITSPVRAQIQPGFGGPQNQPPVSPYLNLLRQGASPGLNYYNLTQPMFQFPQQIGQLQQQVSYGQGQTAVGGPVGGLVTGHVATFGNLSHYYPGRGGARTGGGAGLGGGGIQGPTSPNLGQNIGAAARTDFSGQSAGRPPGGQSPGSR